jgi:ankyrin repeat protein
LNIPAESHGLREIAIFIHALRGETDCALEMIDSLPTVYDPDFAPQRRDLCEGVLRRDAKLIRASLKSINTRFRTVWTIKTYATPTKIRRLGNISEMMPKIRDHIHWHHWLISHWAVAWLSYARHLGVKGVFDDPSLFTQWIPWELCTPQTKPAVKAAVTPAPRMTKGRLKESLFEAIQRDDVEQVKEALKQGVDVEALNLDRLTPLLFAAASGKTKSLQYLLKTGAKKNILDLKYRDALTLAAMGGHAEAVKILLAAGFDVNEKRHTKSPLMFAVLSKSVETVRILLESEADANGNHRDLVETPLSVASGMHLPEMVRLLIDAGANLQPEVTDPPLHRAAESKDLEILKLLISKGADVNAPDFMGETALHNAAMVDFAAGIEVLLKAGANIEAAGGGQTPLLVAADAGAVNAIKVLLKRKANRLARNSRGMLPEEVARGEARSVIRGM